MVAHPVEPTRIGRRRVPVETRRDVIVFDAADLAAESGFWAGVLGGREVPDDVECWHSVVDADGRWRMGVQLAPDHEPPTGPTAPPSRCTSTSMSTTRSRREPPTTR
jgi:hypothetical protein